MTDKDIKAIQTDMHENNRKGITCSREFFDSFVDFVDRQQAEIERLKRELDIALENDPSKIYPYEVITPYGVVFSKCEKGYENFKMDIKSEAIEEFADRLIEVSQWLPLTAIPDRFVTVINIDNLKKEMVGEQGA